jgi:hypothetical protein
MRSPTVALLALLIAGGAAAQEKRLSDVAADIALRPPSEPAVFVDLSPAPGAISSPQTLVELADEYQQNLDAVSDLIVEMADDDTRFYAADWRDQMLEACIGLDTAGYSIAASRAPERYAEAYDGLIDASQDCARATRGVRESIELDQPLYGAAVRTFGECRTNVSRSVGEMHRIRRAELQESQPELEDPLAAAVGIVDLCRARSGADNPAFDACVAAQEEARRSIAGRFSFSVLLDESTFNVIRNSCRLEWPTDFVGRDRCERQRIAEAG